MKVFLGGTCGEFDWRPKLIEDIKGKVSYFNPVVEDWTKECQEEEERQKKICDVHLYVITPEMKGVFSIAEAVESAMTKNKTVLFHVATDPIDGKSFTPSQLKSLRAVENLLVKYDALICPDFRLIKYVLLA